MAGSILKKARRDARKYITKGGYEENLILVSVDGLTTLNTTGWVYKVHSRYDTDGNLANTKVARICLDEDKLKEANYPVRNAEQEVYLRGHRVTAPDSTGVNKVYVIKEWLPDETLGLIVCYLGDYESN